MLKVSTMIYPPAWGRDAQCIKKTPADAFLWDLAKRPDVLALSFHVDYWNSETWQDPFSSPSFSLRQRNYQDTLATDYIYTPQVIVNGEFAAPGGQRSAIETVIENQTSAEALLILSITSDDGSRVVVNASDSKLVSASSLYLAVFSSSEITRIRGGENRGLTLTNVDVVRRLIKISPYDGRSATFQFSLNDLDAAPADGVAVFVQSELNGSIIAASVLMPSARTATRLSMNAIVKPLQP